MPARAGTSVRQFNMSPGKVDTPASDVHFGQAAPDLQAGRDVRYHGLLRPKSAHKTRSPAIRGETTGVYRILLSATSRPHPRPRSPNEDAHDEAPPQTVPLSAIAVLGDRQFWRTRADIDAYLAAYRAAVTRHDLQPVKSRLMETGGLKSFAGEGVGGCCRRCGRVWSWCWLRAVPAAWYADVVRRLESAVDHAGGGRAGRVAVVDRVAYTWFNRIVALVYGCERVHPMLELCLRQDDRLDKQPEVLD